MLAARREMPREERRAALDRLERAFLVPPGTECLLHRRADLAPLGLLEFARDAAVGDDVDVAACELDVDQHAAVVLGIPDPETREQVLRAPAGGFFAEQVAKRQ